MAWAALERRYRSKTAPTRCKLHEQLFSRRLKKGEDPALFMTELEEVRMRLAEMGSVIDDDIFVTNILCRLTPEYDSQVDLHV